MLDPRFPCVRCLWLPTQTKCFPGPLTHVRVTSTHTDHSFPPNSERTVIALVEAVYTVWGYMLQYFIPVWVLVCVCIHTRIHSGKTKKCKIVCTADSSCKDGCSLCYWPAHKRLHVACHFRNCKQRNRTRSAVKSERNVLGYGSMKLESRLCNHCDISDRKWRCFTSCFKVRTSVNGIHSLTKKKKQIPGFKQRSK